MGHARGLSLGARKRAAMSSERLKHRGNAMSRLPELDPEKFSPEQKKVHDAILNGPRGKVVGPLKVWLNNPGPCRARAGARRLCALQFEPAAAALGARDLRHRRVLEGELRVVSRTRRSPSRPASIRPRSRRSAPARTPKLTKSRRAGDLRFRDRAGRPSAASPTRRSSAPRRNSGETSVIDLVGIIGYYSLVSVTLNAFEMPLPEGEKPPFDVR